MCWNKGRAKACGSIWALECKYGRSFHLMAAYVDSRIGREHEPVLHFVGHAAIILVLVPAHKHHPMKHSLSL